MYSNLGNPDVTPPLPYPPLQEQNHEEEAVRLREEVIQIFAIASQNEQEQGSSREGWH